MARRGSSSWTLANYGKACRSDDHRRLEWYPGQTDTVHVGTEKLWQAMGAVMAAYGYRVRNADTGFYNCRPITGGSAMSNHAWPTAGDINWKTNPFIRTPSLRKIRWGVDTDMPAAMVREIESITASGIRAFTWLGRARSIKDAMHYEIRVTLGEIAGGVEAPRGFYGETGDDDMALKLGSKGPAVNKLQKGLNSWKAGLVTVDGDYGPATEAAVKTYQTAAQLLPDVIPGQSDGVTTAFILEYVADRVGGGVGKHNHPAQVTEKTTVVIGEAG